MSTIVCLDTNVYDHLYKGILERPQLEALYSVVVRGEILIPGSTLVLGELIPLLCTDRDFFMGKGQLKLYSTLTDCFTFFKPPDMLLRDAAVSYARRGETAEGFFMAANQSVGADIELLKNPQLEDRLSVRRLERQLREQKGRQFQVMKGLLSSLKDILKKHRVKPHDPPPAFEEFAGDLPGTAPEQWLSWARMYARTAGVLDPCENRGLARMLDIMSLRLCLETAVSLIYQRAFCTPRRPKASDAADLRLVVSCAGARYLVTEDGPLRDVVGRVTVDGFDAVDLSGLLELIGHP